MVKAVIFDMDGVMIDSEPIWSKMEHVFLERRGLSYNKSFKALFMGWSQRSVVHYLQRTYRLAGNTSELINERLSILLEMYDDELTLKSGLIEALTSLQMGGIAQAVATSSPRRLLNYVLKRFSLEQRFKITIAGDEVRDAKPAPEIYLRAAERLHVDSDFCAVVEDSQSGVQSAKSAGMYCIAIPDSRFSIKDDYVDADALIDNLSELPNALRRLIES